MADGVTHYHEGNNTDATVKLSIITPTEINDGYESLNAKELSLSNLASDSEVLFCTQLLNAYMFAKGKKYNALSAIVYRYVLNFLRLKPSRDGFQQRMSVTSITRSEFAEDEKKGNQQEPSNFNK